jgi:hypothetical protein
MRRELASIGQSDEADLLSRRSEISMIMIRTLAQRMSDPA